MANRHVMERSGRSEGMIARAIESQTAKLPSDIFLWAGLVSLGTSLFMSYKSRRETTYFAGQLAPVFLILGLYNKIVKVAGHDKKS